MRYITTICYGADNLYIRVEGFDLLMEFNASWSNKAENQKITRRDWTRVYGLCSSFFCCFHLLTAIHSLASSHMILTGYMIGSMGCTSKDLFSLFYLRSDTCKVQNHMLDHPQLWEFSVVVLHSLMNWSWNCHVTHSYLSTNISYCIIYQMSTGFFLNDRSSWRYSRFHVSPSAICLVIKSWHDQILWRSCPCGETKGPYQQLPS